jgi:rare lipoprotein A (peptidoglycan hydrolase)
MSGPHFMPFRNLVSRVCVAVCAICLLTGCNTTRQQVRIENDDRSFWRHPAVYAPAPPPKEKLPKGALVRVIREQGDAPRYVIIDGESGLTTREHNGGWMQYGVASWYGPGFHGRKTACGETYDQMAMTAAHRTLSFGSRVRVTNLNNNRVIVVRVNDRGPYYDERVIDLSRAAARALDMEHDGLAWVRIELLSDTANEAPPPRSVRITP